MVHDVCGQAVSHGEIARYRVPEITVPAVHSPWTRAERAATWPRMARARVNGYSIDR